ncbi:MAG TPA: formylglycine-generating enzyme family protein, partial [Gemmataceae bacterium]|nr:formylglycine-generating enzyme family protein [Gemmataceae bacterium]
VEAVSWEGAAEFCRRLSELPEEKRLGHLYRLPTEAEWEYSCRGRASSLTPFCFDAPSTSATSTQANFDGNYPYGGAPTGPYLQRTTTVGSYKPNSFGLYDMHGNVYEWCQDWYDENYYRNSSKKDPQGSEKGERRVVRGGSWGSDAGSCRAANRDHVGPDVRGYGVGFRVVLARREDSVTS